MRAKFKIALGLKPKMTLLVALLFAVCVFSLIHFTSLIYVSDSTGWAKKAAQDATINLKSTLEARVLLLGEKLRGLAEVELTKLNTKTGTPGDLSKQSLVLKTPEDFELAYIQKVNTQERRFENIEFSKELQKIPANASHEGVINSASNRVFQDLLEPKLLIQKDTFALRIYLGQHESRPEHYLAWAFFKNKAIESELSKMEGVRAFLVSKDGRAFFDSQIRLGGAAPKRLRQILSALESADRAPPQIHYMRSKTSMISSIEPIGISQLFVVTEFPESRLDDVVSRIRERAMTVGAMIGCLALLFVYFFATSISQPVKELFEASEEVAKGNFSLRLTPKSSDEVGALVIAFNSMNEGLEHREKLKDVFYRFHSKEIADKILAGELKLGGERKKIVAFFSDLRGFTTLSEKADPEKIVSLLNNYFSRMVTIVYRNGGVVDKFIGDAIMAFWGLPSESPEDVRKALHCCLEMRQEMLALNVELEALGYGALAIGMGVHTGEAIAGNIGSMEKMEYTVIGDTVNLTSRLESLTKEYKTDLLVSEAVYNVAKDEFEFEFIEKAAVKGKEELVGVYRVTGTKSQQADSEHAAAA